MSIRGMDDSEVLNLASAYLTSSGRYGEYDRELGRAIKKRLLRIARTAPVGSGMLEEVIRLVPVITSSPYRWRSIVWTLLERDDLTPDQLILLYNVSPQAYRTRILAMHGMPGEVLAAAARRTRDVQRLKTILSNPNFPAGAEQDILLQHSLGNDRRLAAFAIDRLARMRRGSDLDVRAR